MPHHFIPSCLRHRDWFALLFIWLVLALPGTLVLGGSLNRLATEKGSVSQAEEEILHSSAVQRSRSRHYRSASIPLADLAKFAGAGRRPVVTHQLVVGHRISNGLLAPLRI
ncbi:hypothetical protein [Roseimaritima ulvae]|uniref:Uncharacterized protein n=1 Tax=Roseimaritima ulvae TaxID=980254 RepID=A0A5B9QSC6_9BACT|nr:hypothetical protein [Roseimaritima ulvae]QEG40630.1 hypothetical protein UC8_26470 [Roseimaritima ulvae]